MAPLSLITPLFLAATNLTTNLSITLLTPSSTGFLSISSGELKCPNSTVLYSGDLLPLVVDYTYTPFYDPSQPWNGTIPANDAPQGSFDRNGTAEFALKDLKSGWVRFVVQDNTKAEAYSVPYPLKVGSKGVDGCTKPRVSKAVKTALMWLGVFVFPIAAGILICILCWWCGWCCNLCRRRGAERRPRGAPRWRRWRRRTPVARPAPPIVLHPVHQMPVVVPPPTPPPPPAPVPEVQPYVVEEADIVEAPTEEEEDRPPAYGLDTKVPGGV